MRALPWVLFLWATLLGGCATQDGARTPPLQPVGSLDLQRYVGRWYEIARYPNWFQRDCVAVTATYTLREDGRIGVLNECRSERLDGPVRSISGKAWIASDTPGSAKLKVQFFWPFSADYWVIALDPDYRWAIVGEPSRQYLWILARTPTLDDRLYDSLQQQVRELGYDPSRVQKTLQPQPG